MTRPHLEVADIVQQYGAAYLARYGAVTSTAQRRVLQAVAQCRTAVLGDGRSEEHTSELQSHHDLVCGLLLEKKNAKDISNVVTDAAPGVVDIFHGLDKAVADTWNTFWIDGDAYGIGSNLSRQ